MRLTLRTLLAYLDDTLEPSQAKLIGQKVAESDQAQELIARIRQVTRRRRLMTPPATGPGAKFDPNTTAEYLDNELSADQLAAVEEICLSSDVHLAEMAACHQILTLVLGEPAMVPPMAKQRMYGLVQGPDAIPHRRPPEARPAVAAADRVSLSGDEEDEALLLGLPRQYTGAWTLVAAATLFLAASAGALWMATRPGPATQVAQVPPVEPDKLPLPKPDPEPEQPAAKPEASEKPATPVEKPVGDPKPEVKPVEEPKAKPPAPSGPQAPSEQRVQVGRYALVEGRPGVLLKATRDARKPWERLAPEAPVFSTETLTSLPGYRSEIRLDSKVHVQLWGNLPELAPPPPIPVQESAVVLHENSTVDLDFTLTRGRVVLANHKAEGPAVARVRFLAEVWDITLQEPGSTAAVEFISAYDPGTPFSKEPGRTKPTVQVAVLFLEGPAGLKARHRYFGNIRAPSFFVFESDRGPESTPRALPTPPPWWTNKGTSGAPVAKEFLKSLTHLAEQLTPGVSLDVLLTEMRRTQSPASRLVALRAYGAIDDLPHLLDALTDEENDDLRVGAIDTLIYWCGLHPDHDRKLFDLLTNKGMSAVQAEILLQLLHNFSEAQIGRPETYETLIDYLGHDRLPIRELAFRHLHILVPDLAKKVPYHPTWNSEQRERAQEQWRKVLPKGKVPPRPRPQPDKTES